MSTKLALQVVPVLLSFLCHREKEHLLSVAVEAVHHVLHLM